MALAPSSQEFSKKANARPALYLWGVGGVVALLLQAIFRLSEISWQAIQSGEMTNVQYAICAVWILLNAYMEGYRGFQKRFVPRVLARAHHLAHHPERLAAVFAPLYVMAFFRATLKARIAAWAVTLLVIAAVVIVRTLPQPWRGIIDAGVVVGLAWGVVALIVGAVGRLSGRAPTADPELDESVGQPSLNGA